MWREWVVGNGVHFRGDSLIAYLPLAPASCQPIVAASLRCSGAITGHDGLHFLRPCSCLVTALRKEINNSYSMPFFI